MEHMKKYRFRFTLTKAIDFVVAANRRAEAEQFIDNYVRAHCLNGYDALLTIDHSIRSVSKKDGLPYDMDFCRKDEIERRLSAV